MNEIKVNVSIMLPGSILFTQEEAETLEKEQPGSGFDNHSQKLTDVDEKSKKKSTSVIHYKTRKCRPASQSINLCKEAYIYMTSKDSCPEKIKMSKWTNMNRKERLESHLQRLAKHLGGISYTYQVFDD